MMGVPNLRGVPVTPPRLPLHAVLSDEGFRIFFPLAALHAALWPLLWVVVFALELPAAALPAGIWHAHEMVFGAWGAALIGFLTTAAPEWTDAPRLRGRPLWLMAAAWGVARLAGLSGWGGLGWLVLADLVWLVALTLHLGALSLRRKTTRLAAFMGWLAALCTAAAVAKLAMLAGAAEVAAGALRLAGLVFMGLLGLALARITVPVTNLVLDPSEATSPFRPHPGRMNLAPGLVALALAGEIAALSPAVSGFLWVAAGAAFMDRVAEAFVGRAARRAEVLALAGSAALSGAGLLAYGAARLGAPWGQVAPLHLALMGGLGLSVLAVMAIAGRMHTGRPLGLDRRTRAGMVLVVLAAGLRCLPEMGVAPWPPGPVHGLAAAAWAAGFLLWLHAYAPAVADARTLNARRC